MDVEFITMFFLPVHHVLLLINQALSDDERLRDEDSSRQEKKKMNEGKDKTEEVCKLQFFCFCFINI